MTTSLIKQSRKQIRRQACRPPVTTGGIALRPCAEFIADLTIEEPQGDDTSIIPFDLWPAQVDVLKTLLTQLLIIFLKARQLGITWLVLAYALWLCLFHPGKTVLVFSQGKPEAQELIRRLRGMYVRYRGDKPRLLLDNTETLTWSNGSRVRALAATERAGRSFTASLVIFDEYAFMQFGARVFGSAKPTIDAGGQMIIITTANSDDDDFATKWQGAQQGTNGFTPIFLPWHARPSRTAEWYARVETEYDDPKDMLRGYPATPDEAFTPRTADRFVDMALWDRLNEALPPLTRREPVVAAADAGVSSDLFAFVLVSRHPRRRADAVAIRRAIVWTPPKGGKLDFDAIEQEIIAICQEHDVVELVYDPYQLHQMMSRLQREQGIPTRDMPQGLPRLVADKTLRDLIVQGRLAHSGQQTLRSHIDNADKKTTEDKKLRLIKRSAAKKIDLAVATSMAAYRCLELPL